MGTPPILKTTESLSSRILRLQFFEAAFLVELIEEALVNKPAWLKLRLRPSGFFLYQIDNGCQPLSANTRRKGKNIFIEIVKLPGRRQVYPEMFSGDRDQFSRFRSSAVRI
jgi:hypothetical protein